MLKINHYFTALGLIAFTLSVLVISYEANIHHPGGNTIPSGIEDQFIIGYDDIKDQKIAFNASSKDLLVLLHIQKTGGTTFERHLVNDLNSSLPCFCKEEKRRCSCPRPNNLVKPKTIIDSTWLLSRFSTGWICGLHPDWSQLNNCLRRTKKLYFATFLRHPLHRFISEFRHVKRGATWRASRSPCLFYDTTLCYRNRANWTDVSLREFLQCPSNLAINRQTRMLADSDALDCEYLSDQDRLLRSAIKNLESMAFFGLCEEQRLSQLLFEDAFRMKFDQDFKQSEDDKTSLFVKSLPVATREKIIKLNHLDMVLYEHATQLFLSRCKRLTSNLECETALRNLSILGD